MSKISESLNRDATASPSAVLAHPWRDELGAMLKLGVPMALTQLVQFSIMTIDVLMISRLGAAYLAGSSLGMVIFFAIWMVGFGPAMAVSPMVSQALGARATNYRSVRRSVRMGLWAILLIFPFALIVMAFTTQIALALGQPEAPARFAGPYVLALAPGLPFALGVIILRNFLAAIDRTRVPLLIIIVTTAFNAGLNALLIFGMFGFPRLELVGAGIASSLSHMLGFALLAAYIYWDRQGKNFKLLAGFHRPDFNRLREVISLGWPISVTTFFEGMLFNVCVFLVGRIGVPEMAAFQIALNVAALAFMLPWGMSMAGSVRVGLAVGARNHSGVIRAVVVTIALSGGIMVLWGLIVGLFPRWVGTLYVPGTSAEDLVVVGLVAGFLPIAAAFMVFDGVQAAANQCLRGLKDVRMPMILTGVSYWVIGFPVAAGLGLMSSLGAYGVWWGLLSGLLAAFILLGGRIIWLLKKRSYETYAEEL